MTEGHGWRDYSRSQAVLLGAWDYTHLAAVPPARNSLERMVKLLTGPLCGWPASRVQVLRNTPRRESLPDRLMDLFSGITDVALFYFVGHGQLHGDELCLALRESPEVGPRRLTTGLPFADVRAALRECDAQTKIVILDCCFAGYATLPQHSLGPADVIDITQGTGAFTMAASGPYQAAWCEMEGDAANQQTFFTKYLVDVIERGIPGCPQGLPLGTIFAATADALARDRRPQPTRSVRHDADRFLLARNVARPVGVWQPLPPTVPVPNPDAGYPTPTSPVLVESSGGRIRARRLSRRGVLLAGLGVVVAAVGVPVGLELYFSSASSGGPRIRSTVTLADAVPVSHVVFSPDGKTLASISGVANADKGATAIAVWDVATHAKIATLTNSDTSSGVDSVAFSPDSKTLASGNYNSTITLWDPASQSSTYVHDPYPGGARLTSVAFSPDGKTLASADEDDTLLLWDLITQARPETLSDHDTAYDVAFSPNGAMLASANTGTVTLWDVASHAVIATFNVISGGVTVRSVAFSPDGKTLASLDSYGTIKLWDTSTHVKLGTLASNAEAVAFSPDGKILASGNDDGTVTLWDPATRAITLTLTGHTDAVNSVAFSPDGTLLASGGNQTIVVWTFG